MSKLLSEFVRREISTGKRQYVGKHRDSSAPQDCTCDFPFESAVNHAATCPVKIDANRRLQAGVGGTR